MPIWTFHNAVSIPIFTHGENQTRQTMYSALINGKKSEVEASQDNILVDGEKVDWDLVKISETMFHILYKHRSYEAEIVSVDHSTKTFVFRINGHLQTVILKDKFDQLLEKMGMNASASGKVNSIKAPMPGLIIDLKIHPGDIVNAGDQLLILEAMKMENIIKSPGAAVVKTVHVKKGDSVEKGQVLIEF